MKKTIVFLSLFALATSVSTAQDYHFSQFFNAPLTLNPALTGRIREDFRVGVIHRSQWKAVNSPYVTSAMSADMNFVKNPLGLDMIGAGLVLVNDEIGDGIFSSQQVLVSGSAMKSLDELKRHKLSFGLQLGYTTRGLNSNRLVFDSQIRNYQLDPSISSGETINNRYGYLNANAGIFWDFLINRKFEVFAGYSAYNLTRPKENPLTTTKNSTVPIRHVLNPGMYYHITPRLDVIPNLLMVYQGGASEINVGAAAGYTFNPDRQWYTTAYLGGWFRTKDSFIAYTGLNISHIRIGFSYDFTVSGLRDVRRAPDIKDRAQVGAWEISLTYVGFFKRAIPNDVTIPCRFF